MPRDSGPPLRDSFGNAWSASPARLSRAPSRSSWAASQCPESPCDTPSAGPSPPSSDGLPA
eukprot:2950580-Alexandrium_andersonii.AAC.1